jgi:class 3 adenylate cyclase
VDQPPIQYCTTKDDVSIAFWEMGEGPPLIYLPPLPQHAQLDWQIPDLRRRYETLAARHRLIRFDRRNTGLSQRGVANVSREAFLWDIDALREHLALDSFYLIGHGTSAALAIAYTAERAGVVRRLVLIDSSLTLPGVELSPPVQALRAIVEHDWETFTEVLSGLVWGWAADQQTRQYADLIRSSWSWEEAKRSLGYPGDIAGLLGQIAVPTLIVHHRETVVTSIETGRILAARIPGARLVSLEGRAVGASFANPNMIESVDAFLAEGEATIGERDQPSGTAIILFADIADSTALTERLGDAVFRERARELDTTLREIIRGRAGRPIEGKLLGDGVLATFASAKDAIDAATDVAHSGDGAGLPLHVGLHAGDVIREDSNVFGGAVNIASRISGLTAPGEVLVSQTVRDLARTSAGVSFEDRGKSELKGVSEPVRVFCVKEQGTGNKEQGA